MEERTPGEWAKLIQTSEEYRDDHLFAMREMVQAAHGPHYVRSGMGRFLPENHYYAYMTLMVPRLIFDNPTYQTRTRRPGSQKYVAEAIRHGLNRWAKDTDLRTWGVKIAVDFLFNWGMVMVRQIPIPGQKTEEKWIWDKDGTFRVAGEKLWPSVYRVPQDRVIVDHRADALDEVEYMGHRWTRNYEELLREAKAHPDRGWDAEAIASLGSNNDEQPNEDPLDLHQDKRDWPVRKTISGYTIWVPDLQLDGEPGPEEGYHGTLLTIGHLGGANERQTAAKFLKEPRPYYGPKEGPYVMFGAYLLPNKLYPLSPLVAVEGQIRELNRHARAWSRSAEAHKRVVLYDMKDRKTASELRRAKNDFYIGIPGFEKQRFAEAELGGATDAQYKAFLFLQERLNRVSSMDEAQQGGVTGLGTATEHTIADEASMTRLAFLKQQYTEAMCEVSRRVAWFMYHDDRVVFPLGEEAAEDLDMTEPWFHGGDPDPESDATFDDLELEIEPYSMERTDQAGIFQKTMDAANFVMTTAQMIPLMPWVDWELLYDQVGSAMNMPLLPDMIDVEAAIAQGQFMMAQQENQPRLAKDVGASSSGGGQPMRKAPQLGGMQVPQLTKGSSSGASGGSATSGNRIKGLMGSGGR